MRPSPTPPRASASPDAAAVIAAGRARRAAAKPVAQGSPYPAKQFCSNCGLCDSEWVAHVGEACAFLGDGEKKERERGMAGGVYLISIKPHQSPLSSTFLPSGMSKSYALEPAVHGRHRALDDAHELRYGVTASTFFARATPPLPGAQWTGVVTRIAVAALEAGVVDAVVCVQADARDPLTPKPVVARTAADVVAARGVKPVLSPTLAVLPTVEALAADATVRNLLFVGVGCQVQAVRAVEQYLDLDNIYVLGTNCADNGTRAGLASFLDAAAPDPANVAHDEFAQDYRVHVVERERGEAGGGACETRARVPYFSLPAADLTDAIAPSCYSCFDYTNGLADVVVGYMGVPPPLVGGPLEMRTHFQHVTSRNARGDALLAAARGVLETKPATSWGERLVPALVRATVAADDDAKLGAAPDPAPRAVGNIIATLLTWLGPKGLAFGRYSVDYHALRNWLFVRRHWGNAALAERHVPPHARAIVAAYDKHGEMTARAAIQGTPPPPPARVRE